MRVCVCLTVNFVILMIRHDVAFDLKNIYIGCADVDACNGQLSCF